MADPSPNATPTTSAAERIFFEVFEQLPRQGPGSIDCARRALALCEALPRGPRVLDLGCGGGAQTLQLASLLDGDILAIDQHLPFIEKLRHTLATRGLAPRVRTEVGDMNALRLAPESFDLIWSEGALYNIGMDAACSLAQSLLAPGGYLAFTDAVWRSTDIPEELHAAFADYPGMGHVEDTRVRLDAHNFQLIGDFALPPSAWREAFYTPMEIVIAELRPRYADDDQALSVLDSLAQESDMHRRLGHHYGYQFFVARKA